MLPIPKEAEEAVRTMMECRHAGHFGFSRLSCRVEDTP